VTAIELDHVSLRLGEALILRDVSLKVEASEVMALLGPSGSGKSSILRLVLGFIAPSAGIVRLNGRDVSSAGRIEVPPEERHLAVVFQDLALWPHLTVWGNLAFGLSAQRIAKEEQAVRIAEMLKRVGLTGREGRFISELSGGERQRVAIARALVLRPQAVLFDEPFSSLDVGLKRELLGMVRELLAEFKATSLFVTHDAREAAALGNRIAVLTGGHLVQVGTMAELAKKPAEPFVQSLIDDLTWTGAGL